ncbi:SRPBCC family protein [Arthrobacter gengyunqii]|uniref:SRPBCC family protein n=1 Tax=Arthrobacter gengyunqii TaxID=2886940 RepID=A0A9X1M537_9MICC|nr:SRPBCC family protein [Arthrobacter gengyunqii]MCC3271070.1 SRPBCC family protein [Arthrobacter gengyunqii]UOY96760.1 SRPBCC family protein [Arthrobacter gengyunqii]
MSNPLTLSAPADEPLMEYSRDFDFPVHDVFRAHVEPDAYAQWIGPQDVTTRIDRFEPRTGGSYRFVHSRGSDEYAFRGVFHTVRQDEFLLQTFEFEADPEVVTLEYSTFTALPGGRCRLTGRSLYPSVESRDQFLANGMEEGMSDGYNQLDEFLARNGSTG